MQYHGVHKMAQQKKKQGLVCMLIDKLMRETLDPSRQALAFSLGNPAREQAGSNHSFEDELTFRSNYLYTNIFPDHASCVEHCEGHTLPKVSALVLEKLTTNHDLSSWSLKEAVPKWFQEIDTDTNGTLEKAELLAELLRLGLPEVSADFFLKHFDANTNGVLEMEEFERAIVHMLDTSIPGLSAGKMIALFGCLVKQAADSQVSLKDLKIDPVQFLALTQEFSSCAFAFTG